MIFMCTVLPTIREDLYLLNQEATFTHTYWNKMESQVQIEFLQIYSL
jgi:hypothetical protein